MAFALLESGASGMFWLKRETEHVPGALECRGEANETMAQ
jgi:hypothetical protein